MEMIFSLRFYEFLCIARSFKSDYSLQQDLCMKFSHVGFLIVTKRREFKWNYARKTLSEDVKLSKFRMSYDDCVVLLNSSKPVTIILFVKCKISEEHWNSRWGLNKTWLEMKRLRHWGNP